MLYREIIAVCSQIHTKHINTAVWAERGIFICIYKIAKRDCKVHHVCVCVCVCVLPFACNNSTPTGRLFMKFDIYEFFEKSVDNIPRIKIKWPVFYPPPPPAFDWSTQHR